MRWLEGSPGRYDAGMRVLTLGRVARVHDALAEHAVQVPEARVLEIGCGTGALTARLVARGAFVTAIDQNPEMMEQARARLAGAPPRAVSWRECTASEIDALPEEAFDAVVASLSLSEMSPDERRFVMRESRLRLRPGGRLVLGDELRPRRSWQRLVHALLRAPQALLGWLLAGSVSRPIPNLPEEVRAAGFQLCGEQRWLLGRLGVVIGERVS
jgi:demethylmenaquinone methyltransferase/2-methoxy-6-polyprenyl-1,4-benzoquinol methylase